MPKLLIKLLEFFQPQYRPTATPDSKHFHRRRMTKGYRSKQATVKNIWIASGCIMITYPVVQFIIPALLFTSFVAFCILDET